MTKTGKRVPAPRRMCRSVSLGDIEIGGEARIPVQSMTNTDTRDVEATTAQIRAVSVAGCDIVRLAIPDQEAVSALGKIRNNVPGIPLVADIHFDYRLALLALEAGVDGLRINPGNIGGVQNVRDVAREAAARQVPIRVGVNGGSLETALVEQYGGATPEAMVESALRHVRILEDLDFRAIKISVKASDVPRTVAAYRLLASACDYPLHLGVTEAGTLLAGTVVSSVGIGLLLADGIGDTIRVSLTASPVQEVRVGLMLLRSLGLRPPGANVTSCPTCGRTQVDLEAVAETVESRLDALYSTYAPGNRPHVAVMGCMVNGPGEAKEADIALVGGHERFALFERGRHVVSMSQSEAVDALIAHVEAWMARNDPQKGISTLPDDSA